jgi:tetratricopeptide (TPR) repeat protein
MADGVAAPEASLVRPKDSRTRKRASDAGRVLSFAEARRHKASSRSRWRDVAEELGGELWPKLEPSFRLRPGEIVFTIGSCFARNIEANLEALGCRVPMLGFRLPAEEFDGPPNAAMNKFHPPAFRQCLEWTARIYDRDGVVCWEDCEPLAFESADGLYFDLDMAATVVPASRERFIARRQHVYDVFATAFAADCLMMTPGLIEAWRDLQTGLYMYGAPYEKRMLAVPERWQFEVLSYPRCLEDLLAAIDVVRRRNPDVKVLVTTSPVPLNRTFTERDVTVANAHSKAVLRAACDAVLLERDRIDYFPSYEMVTLSNPDMAWKADRLHVSQGFIGKLVSYMLDTYFEGVDAASADYQRARILYASGDAAGAEGAARAALAARPQHLEARILLGSALTTLQRWDEAISVLAPAIEVDARRADARAQMACALAGAGRAEEAVQAAEAVMALPSFAIGVFLGMDGLLGRILPADAVRLCERAGELFPRHMEVYPRLVDALLRAGRSSEAISALRGAAELPHPPAALLARLSRLLLERGEAEEALARAEAALGRDPRNKDALALKARLLPA